MKQLIFLIFLINYTLAYEFKLNGKDIKYINNSDKKSFIENRLDKYKNLKIQVKDYELIKKLSYINSFVNKILPAYDTSTQASLDYWATPKEFLLQGHGDCEDYVITKYFTLLEVGIPKEKLYFVKKEPIDFAMFIVDEQLFTKSKKLTLLFKLSKSNF